jgi:hypothetical protein
MRSNSLFCVHVHSTSYSRDFDKVRRRIFSSPETMAPQCWHDFFRSSVDCCDCSRFPLIQFSRVWVVDGLSLLTVLVTSIYGGSIGRPTIWFLFHRICLGQIVVSPAGELLLALKNGEQRFWRLLSGPRPKLSKTYLWGSELYPENLGRIYNWRHLVLFAPLSYLDAGGSQSSEIGFRTRLNVWRCCFCSPTFEFVWLFSAFQFCHCYQEVWLGRFYRRC